MTKQQTPKDWPQARLAAVADYYGQQTEDEALAEFEGALSRDASALIEVPVELVAAVQSLIEHYESIRAATART